MIESFELHIDTLPFRKLQGIKKGSFKKNGKQKYLSSNERTEIIKLYPDNFNYELAEKFDVSESAIYNIKRKYNLKKSKVIMNAARFKPKHKPFNKDLPMIKWMDGRKIKKVMKYLELGRVLGNPELHEFNRIPIVGIKDGRLFPFKSSVDAANILKAKRIRVNSRNIRAVCKQEKMKVGKYYYKRKKAGGFMWFYADEPELYQEFLK